MVRVLQGVTVAVAVVELTLQQSTLNSSTQVARIKLLFIFYLVVHLVKLRSPFLRSTPLRRLRSLEMSILKPTLYFWVCNKLSMHESSPKNEGLCGRCNLD